MKTVTILLSMDSGTDWDGDQRDRFAALMLNEAQRAYPGYAWDLEWHDFVIKPLKVTGVSWEEYDTLTEYVGLLSESVWEAGDFWEPLE